MAEIEIGANDARIQITATAGQTVFTYDFPVFDQDHIVVEQTLASDGTTSTLTITTHYTVTGVGEEDGGTVVLVTGAAEDDVLTLYRNVPAARETDFQTAGDFLTSVLNREFDLLTMMIQEIVRDQARSIIMNSADTASFDPTMPILVGDRLLRIKSDKSGFELVAAADVDLALVSAFALTLLDDASASAARTTLGLGTAAVEAASAFEAADADILKADTADTLEAGFDHTPDALGTITSGTVTPAFADGNVVTYTNGGGHTLAPPASGNGTLVMQVTNNASAGAVTTSGFTQVTGDTVSTTDGDDFFFYITKIGSFSLLHVVALQ